MYERISGRVSRQEAARCTCTVWQNNMATCVLLFFLDPLRALQSESWIHVWLKPAGSHTALLSRLQGYQLPFGLQLEPLQELHTLCLFLTGAIYCNWNQDDTDVHVHFSFSCLRKLFFWAGQAPLIRFQCKFCKDVHFFVFDINFCNNVSSTSSWLVSAISTVAPISPAARQAPFRPASPRRRRKHRKRISKAAIRAMIM